jgi:hypothetical protein
VDDFANRFVVAVVANCSEEELAFPMVELELVEWVELDSKGLLVQLDPIEVVVAPRVFEVEQESMDLLVVEEEEVGVY